LGVEILEPHTHGPIAVFEAGGHEPVLHLCHLGPDRNHQAVGGSGGEHRIPSPTQPFAYRARSKYVGSAAAGDDDGLGLEDVELVLSNGEPHRARDLLGVVGVGQQVGDCDPFVQIFGPDGFPGRFGGDGLD